MLPKEVKSNKKYYKVAVSETLIGTLYVEASNEEEAKELAYKELCENGSDYLDSGEGYETGDTVELTKSEVDEHQYDIITNETHD